MKAKRATIATFVLSVIGVSGASGTPAGFVPSMGQAQDAGQPAVARRIGAIKAITGNAITLAPDSGPEVAVTVQPNARLLRIAPGAKDLDECDSHPVAGLASGRSSASARTGNSRRRVDRSLGGHCHLPFRSRSSPREERQDWQKRGLGGLVSAVDASSGTVTISVTSLGGKKEIAVHTSNTTVFRRYAPDSVKFDDAKSSSLQEIQPGDQLRARGARSADGSELTAEEIVTGSFRNIAGTVNSVDASAGTLIVQDLLSKKAVPVKITPESQLHKLPPEMAQRIAARLKGSMPPGTPGAAGSANSTSAPVAANKVSQAARQTTVRTRVVARWAEACGRAALLIYSRC